MPKINKKVKSKKSGYKLAFAYEVLKKKKDQYRKSYFQAKLIDESRNNDLFKVRGIEGKHPHQALKEY